MLEPVKCKEKKNRLQNYNQKEHSLQRLIGLELKTGPQTFTLRE